MENVTDKHEALLSKLRHLVTSATSKGGPSSQDETDVIIPAVRALLEDDFEGSRAVRGHIWNLVLVVGRAFPVLLHPSIEKVKAFARLEGLGDNGKMDLWIQEGLNEGVICGFIQKIPTQFHIMSAYLPGAVMCNESARKEFEHLAAKLKGLLQPVPKVQVPSSVESVGDTLSEPLSPQSSIDQHTVSSASTPSRAQPPHGPIFRRISSKGLSAKLEKAFSHEQEGPVRVVLQVANDEAGEGPVTVGFVYPSGGGDSSGSFMADVASGFNTMWGSLSKLPANLEKIPSLKAPLPAKDKRREKVKSPEHPKRNPINFQNVWSGIAKPFVKPLSPSHAQESEKTGSAVDEVTTGGIGKSKDAELEEDSEVHAGVMEKRKPNWLNQSGLGFLHPVLSGSERRASEGQKDESTSGQHQDSTGMAAGEKKKPEFLQSLFRKSSSKVVHEQEDSVEPKGGHELGSVLKTEPQPQLSIGELEKELSTGDPLLRISVSDLEAELRGDHYPRSPSSAFSTVTGASEGVSTSGLVDSGDEFKGFIPGGEQLVDDVRAASRALLDLSAQDSVGSDCQNVLDLCAAIEKVLGFHMRNKPRPWRPSGSAGLKFFTDIGDKIAKGHNFPFFALKNAQLMSANLEVLPDGLGVDVIEGMESVSGHSHQLHAWLRSSLNSGNLEERFKALVGEETFWEGWYERGSIMGREEGRAKFVDALEGLDGVRFLLAVDKWPGKEEDGEVNVWARLTGRVASSSPTLTLSQTPEVASVSPSPNPLSPNSTASMPVIPRRKSQKKKRVVTFDGESFPPPSVEETPASTPALSPLPFSSFEGSEPLSPTTLARLLGMGGEELDLEAGRGDRQQKALQDVKRVGGNAGLVDGQEAGLDVDAGGDTTQEDKVHAEAKVDSAPSVDDSSQIEKTFSEQIEDIMREGGLVSDARGGAPSCGTRLVRETKISPPVESVKFEQSAQDDVGFPVDPLEGNSERGAPDAGHVANPLQDEKTECSDKTDVAVKSTSEVLNKIDHDGGRLVGVNREWSLRGLIVDSTEASNRNVADKEAARVDDRLEKHTDPVMDDLKIEESFQEIMQQAEVEVASGVKLGRGGDFMLAKRDWGSLSLEEFEDLHASDLGFSPEELVGGLDSDAFSSSSDVESVTSRQAMDALDELIRGDFMADVDRYSGGFGTNVSGVPAEVSSTTHKGSPPGGVPRVGQEAWEGVWKDVDVIRAETVEGSSGEFTVYVMEVTASDGTNWQVTRRFRDLASLRKKVKAREGVVLPKSWDNIKKSRHITGRSRLSPEIVEARNALMRQCLWDLRVSYPASFGWEEVAFFLDAPLHLLKGVKVRTGEVTEREETPVDVEKESLRARTPTDALGDSQRLLVELQPAHTDRELVAMQGGLCPGCSSLLPDFPPPKSFTSYFWRSSASSGPLKCHYTNLLYCNKCHKNETEVIPADVLHNWDFTEKAVCIASKEYLASIKTQPLLCLGVINAGLFARVPLLARVQSLRQKVIRTVDIVKGAGAEGKAMAESLVVEAGTYGHLLESPDFWSLRDLIDISKGSAFSSLPRWLEAMSGRVGRIATTAVLKYDD
ncbi:hypothetical protein BSKO_01485 [Bryopsis sp. KO-2023]|nr:hypothetical protein BSKO_01485 [Bryopsis sp. KO-2023]